jgi:hypothetical protein
MNENNEGPENGGPIFDRARLAILPDEPMDLDPSDLNEAQRARSEALYHARQVLERKGGAFTGAGTIYPPKVEDLITVADYILTGEMLVPDGEG